MDACISAIFPFSNGNSLFGKFWSEKNCQFKDTHREKAPSNKTPVLIKSTNIGIWIVGTTNQLFTRGF